jgi:hypothetical protein
MSALTFALFASILIKGIYSSFILTIIKDYVIGGKGTIGLLNYKLAALRIAITRSKASFKSIEYSSRTFFSNSLSTLFNSLFSP